jgi:hypothetical protein
MQEKQKKLIAWVKEQQKNGYSETDIRTSAIKSGWDEKDLDLFFKPRTIFEQAHWQSVLAFFVVLAIIGFIDYVLYHQLRNDSLEMEGIGLGIFLGLCLLFDAIGFLLIIARKVGGYPILLVFYVLKLLTSRSSVNFFFTGNRDQSTSLVYLFYALGVVLLLLLVYMAYKERGKVQSSSTKVRLTAQGKTVSYPKRIKLFQISSRNKLIALGWCLAVVLFTIMSFVNYYGTEEGYRSWDDAIFYVAVVLILFGVVFSFFSNMQIGKWVIIVGMLLGLIFAGEVATIVGWIWFILTVAIFFIIGILQSDMVNYEKAYESKIIN